MDKPVKDHNSSVWVPMATGEADVQKALVHLQQGRILLWDSAGAKDGRATKAAEIAINSSSFDEAGMPLRKGFIKADSSYIKPELIFEKFKATSEEFKGQIGDSTLDDTFEFFHYLQRVFGIAAQASEFFLLPDSTPPRIKSLLGELPRMHIPSNKTLKKFTLFPKLPLELRNKIWKIASLKFGVTSIDAAVDRDTYRPMFFSRPYSHSILCTSREARQEGLRHFQKCVVKTKEWWHATEAENKRWKKDHYINFNHTTFVGTNLKQYPFELNRYSAFVVGDLAKIQYVTITHRGYQPRGVTSNIADFIGPLSYMPNLQRVTIIISNWCAVAGVQQGVGQELYRKELDNNFEKTMKQVLKDAKSKAELRIFFQDWNDSDTAPCSADPEKGRGTRYFDRAEA